MRSATPRRNPKGCAILDTRKTIPGLRQAQKYAVRIGGGKNQRLALWHGILIKENHIAAAGGVSQVLRQCAGAAAPASTSRSRSKRSTQLNEALAAGARSVLLDNFSFDAMREAVAINAGRALLEVSGNVTLEQVRDDRRHRRRPDLDRPADQGRAGDRFFAARQ